MNIFRKSNQLLGFSSLITATFLYGWYGVFSKLIAFNLPIFFASTARSLMAAIILTIPLVITWKASWKRIAKKDWAWVALRSLLGLIADICLFIAFINLEIGTAYFIFYGMSTVTGYLLGRVLFQEKLDSVRISALLLAVLGLYLIYQINFTPNSGLYVLLAALSGIGAAVWNTFAKKLSDKYSPLQLNWIDMVICVLVAAAFSVLRRESWVMPDFSYIWMYNLLFTLMYVITGQLIVIGFKYLDAQIGSLVMLLEILFGILLGFLFFRETLTLLTLLGGLLIITAVVLPEIRVKSFFWQKLLRS